MQDLELQMKILEATELKKIKLMPQKSQFGLTQFTEVNFKVNKIFNARFENLWEQIEVHFGKYIEKVLPGKYDKTVHKKVFREVMNEQVKYILYGKIYEMAKNGLDDPILEKLIIYDNRTGFFDLKNAEALLDYIIDGIFFPVIILMDLSEGKVEELNTKIKEQQNRFGTYSKELFIEAYRLQELNKGKRPKITDEDSIVMANERLKVYEAMLLINDKGQKTALLLSMTKSYSNYHKPLLKKGGGQY